MITDRSLLNLLSDDRLVSGQLETSHETPDEPTRSPADPRDPHQLAPFAPLFAAWVEADRRDANRFTSFTLPGHKSRTDLVGTITASDHALYGGLAPAKQADQLVAQAEAEAAAHFGADWLRFSVGGSTHGNQALLGAVARPGDSVIVSRTMHRSTLLGLVATGLTPIWIAPPVHLAAGVPLPMPPETVAAALEDHPEAVAVFLTEPSYVGGIADIGAIAGICHHNGVPLIVDAAWGAHFGTHPAMPPNPLSVGADAVVTSGHKTLPVFSQGAYVMARTKASGGMLDADRLERSFAAGHTTSPSSAILASLDAARALLQLHGERLSGELISLVADARDRLSAIPRLVVFGHGAGRIATLDPAKLVLQLSGTGVHGHDLEKFVGERGVSIELADRDLVIPMVTMADGPEHLDRLIAVIAQGIEALRASPRQMVPSAAWRVSAEQVISPREAFYAEQVAVPWAEAVGRVCAEIIAPYPPGVPVLSLGERITVDALDALAEARQDGSRIAYAADPTGNTVRVLRAPDAR